MFGFLWNYIYRDNELEQNEDETKNSPQDFYFLSLIKEDDSWSIHGLWPQTSLTKYPQYCRNVEFDLELLNPIIDRLRDEWYSNRGADEIFWKHEYLKHGTCNYNNFNEFQYFKTALDLFDKAKSLNLPSKYYNSQTEKCLIPVNQKLEFFDIN